MKSILQDWVMELGLRHQGVLVSAVRGCDGVPKNDPSKAVVRFLRGAILNPHCGDARRARSFIEVEDPSDFEVRRVRELAEDPHAHLRRLGDEAFKNHVLWPLLKTGCDHLPHHYVMHLTHAVEVVAYHHPDADKRARWLGLYQALVRSFHLAPETKEALDARLNAGEAEFSAAQEVR